MINYRKVKRYVEMILKKDWSCLTENEKTFYFDILSIKKMNNILKLVLKTDTDFGYEEWKNSTKVYRPYNGLEDNIIEKEREEFKKKLEDNFYKIRF